MSGSMLLFQSSETIVSPAVADNPEGAAGAVESAGTVAETSIESADELKFVSTAVTT